MSKAPYWTIEPYRIGVIVDLPASPGNSDLFVIGLELGAAEVLERGIGDRPIEFVVREYATQPWASAHHNLVALNQLVNDEHVIGIAGPMTSDNALSILPAIERMEVPVVSICGSQEFAGEYCFSTPNGGMADEPMVLLSWLKANGYSSFALIKETPSQIGEEYAQNVRMAARQIGLKITIEQGVSPLANIDDPSFGRHGEVDDALQAARATHPDCLVYFGLGHLAAVLKSALERIGWNPERFAGTAFVGASWTEAYIDAWDGWTGLDQWDERNATFQLAMARYEQKFGKPLAFPTSVFTCGFDIGRAYAIAVDRMRIATGPALRNALETITRLPAATGAVGTIVSFSKRNHRGFKGADYLLLRKSEAGKNFFVGTAPLI